MSSSLVGVLTASSWDRWSSHDLSRPSPTAADRHRGTRSDAPSWYGVEEIPAPDLDAHQPKNRVGRIDASSTIIGNQRVDGNGIEETATAHGDARERVVDEFPQIAVQPPAHRRAETGFGPKDDLARQTLLDRLLEHPFALTSALLQVVRQRIRQLPEIVVEKRHPHLDARR